MGNVGENLGSQSYILPPKPKSHHFKPAEAPSTVLAALGYKKLRCPLSGRLWRSEGYFQSTTYMHTQTRHKISGSAGPHLGRDRPAGPKNPYSEINVSRLRGGHYRKYFIQVAASSPPSNCFYYIFLNHRIWILQLVTRL